MGGRRGKGRAHQAQRRSCIFCPARAAISPAHTCTMGRRAPRIVCTSVFMPEEKKQVQITSLVSADKLAGAHHASLSRCALAPAGLQLQTRASPTVLQRGALLHAMWRCHADVPAWPATVAVPRRRVRAFRAASHRRHEQQRDEHRRPQHREEALEAQQEAQPPGRHVGDAIAHCRQEAGRRRERDAAAAAGRRRRDGESVGVRRIASGHGWPVGAPPEARTLRLALERGEGRPPAPALVCNRLRLLPRRALLLLSLAGLLAQRWDQLALAGHRGLVLCALATRSGCTPTRGESTKHRQAACGCCSVL